MTDRSRLAVLGSPIAHSRSPRLHAAAYRVLGLDWDYEAIEVTEDALPGFLGSLDGSWRGLSLTMPLKRTVLPLLDHRDELVDLVGGANTVLLEHGRASGFNTDVYGFTQSFQRRGVSSLDRVLVLGGGATAATAVAAVGRLGAQSVQVLVRSPERAQDLIAVGESTGTTVTIGSFDEGVPTGFDAVINTLPNGIEVPIAFSEADRTSAVLFDVTYDPWPTSIASVWAEVGGEVISGREMLVHQALIQIRIFVSGNPELLLPDEASVLEAMWKSIDL